MKKTRKRHLCICGILLSLIVCGGIGCYCALFRNNVHPDHTDYLYVPTGTDYDGLLQLLDSGQVLRHSQTFRWVARLRHLPTHVRPGRYAIRDGCSNYTLTSHLRSGNQEAVKVRFNNIRTLPQFAGRISRQLELDSTELMQLLLDDSVLNNCGMKKETAICLFIPNTYECWWNTSASDFLKRMQREYKTFWNENRLKKASDMGMSPQEVMTLASIVEEENSRHEEQARIAGLYVNRLHKGMLLQSDPTVKFALGDFGRKRLLYEDLKIDSPYNTYRYPGLPPGPIRMASITSIDAVLNYEHHPYLYMCAKDDFSGYHYFTANPNEHAAYAQRYHAALNRNKIKR